MLASRAEPGSPDRRPYITDLSEGHLHQVHAPSVATDDRDVRIREPAAQLKRGEKKRATEVGAEAIALAYIASTQRYQVVRRLQSTKAEGADWLLRDPGGAEVLLEIAGTDEGDLTAVAKAKRAQAEGSIYARKARPSACVVRFKEPALSYWQR